MLLEIDWQLEAVVGKPQTRSEAWGEKRKRSQWGSDSGGSHHVCQWVQSHRQQLLLCMFML